MEHENGHDMVRVARIMQARDANTNRNTFDVMVDRRALALVHKGSALADTIAAALTALSTDVDVVGDMPDASPDAEGAVGDRAEWSDAAGGWVKTSKA